jgi:hypothetical protein
LLPQPSQTIPKGKPKKRADYLEFIHQLPCVITGQYGVEAAHLSFASPFDGHFGRGKGRKAPDRFTLPMTADAHRRQHTMNEGMFWLEAGIFEPHRLANALYGLWCDHGEDALPYAIEVIKEWQK